VVSLAVGCVGFFVILLVFPQSVKSFPPKLRVPCNQLQFIHVASQQLHSLPQSTSYLRTDYKLIKNVYRLEPPLLRLRVFAVQVRVPVPFVDQYLLAMDGRGLNPILYIKLSYKTKQWRPPSTEADIPIRNYYSRNLSK
jgi:hypothetical protein